MAPEKISGRIGCRLVGIIELLLTSGFSGVYTWQVIYFYWDKLQLQECWQSLKCLILPIFGAYLFVGIFMALTLIVSTFSSIGLHGRKWIAVYWCLFNMISFIGAVIFICVSDLCQDINWFLLMIGFLIKMAVFFCIVCTYVWGISEKIMDKKLYAMPVSPVHVKRGRRAVSATM